MNLLSILLQATTDIVTSAPTVEMENKTYFYLLLKGGLILIPLGIMFVLANYFMIERWISIKMLGKIDVKWYTATKLLVAKGKLDEAKSLCIENPSIYSKLLIAGLDEAEHEDNEVQDALQAEARQQISVLEKGMNYLGIIASIAPMFGFLGTIFGVIKIFYNISITNDLNIANISDGLYQKMISSGAGLFVGIVAYTGYYILNGRIDKVVLKMDKTSNELIKAIRQYKRSK